MIESIEPDVDVAAGASSSSIHRLSERWPPARVFFWLGGVCLALLVVLTPPFETPDEQQHFFRAYGLSEGHVLPQVQDGHVGGLIPNSLPQLAMEFLGTSRLHPAPGLRPARFTKTLDALQHPLDSERQTFVEFGTMYLPTGYAPQVVGIWIGRLLHIGPLGLLYFARTANAVVAFWLVLTALRQMPGGAAAGLLLALLPSSQMAFASCSPDSLTLATALLFGALALREATGRTLGAAGLAGLVAAVGAFGISKFAYLPLTIAAAVGSKWRRAVFHVALGLAALAAAGIWIFVSAKGFGDVRPGTDLRHQLAFVVSEPLHFVRAIWDTIRSQGFHLGVQFIGQAGWLDLSLPFWLYGLLLVAQVLALVAGAQVVELRARTFLAWCALGAASATLIFLAMYLNWTPLAASKIEGVQGRYFVPIACILGPALSAMLSRINLGELRLVAYWIMLAVLAVGSVVLNLTIVQGFNIF